MLRSVKGPPASRVHFGLNARDLGKEVPDYLPFPTSRWKQPPATKPRRQEIRAEFVCQQAAYLATANPATPQIDARQRKPPARPGFQPEKEKVAVQKGGWRLRGKHW